MRNSLSVENQRSIFFLSLMAKVVISSVLLCLSLFVAF